MVLVKSFGRVLVTLLTVVATAVLGSGARSEHHPALVIDAPAALSDQPVRIQVTGLDAGQRITVESTAKDYAGRSWQADAAFTADSSGTVDLARQSPTSGSYQGADSTGPLWSMHPTADDSPGFIFTPLYPQLQPTFEIDLAVYANGRRLTGAVLDRTWMAPGVTHRALTLQQDKAVGELYLPAPGIARHPAVLVFGGSEGGESQEFTAALLASHGYPTLSLGYFNLPGLPDALDDIPLEYFASAARLLAAQPGVDPAHVLAMGYSRGSEAALLLAQDFPALIHGAVVYSPSAAVNVGFPNETAPAWTLAGRAVPKGIIPLTHVSGPVLAIAGQDDQLWPSPDSAARIDGALARAGDPYPHRALIYPKAGHGVGTFPYLPADTQSVHPVLHQLINLGGTRPGNEAAQRAGWSSVLSLLATLS